MDILKIQNMKGLLLVSLFAITFLSILSISVQYLSAQNSSNLLDTDSFVYNTSFGSNQDAKNIYEDKSFTVDKNVSNFVVLIPNEGHESTNQEKNQYPFVNQSYIPQNLTTSKGTSVAWLNADVDHNHIIKFQPGNPQNLVESNQFAFPEYTTIVFDQLGPYPYYEDNVNEDDESFVMEGTINVVDTNSESMSSANTSSIQNGKGTMGVLMVPSQEIENIKTELKNSGIMVLSDYSFTDLRGGQDGTGPTQSIVIWGSKSNNLEQTMAPIVDITERLPYS